MSSDFNNGLYLAMVGKRIAHFEVIDELGSGGMGIVYRAQDTRLERQVAIKALPEALSEEPERLARLKKEARALASLNHSHIGAIYGLEEVANRHYLILELIEGETLAEMLQNGPLPLRECFELGCQIAAALETAHDNGIIHRDLKPANVKVTPQGEAKVLDFGLAKRTQDMVEGAAKADSVLPTATWRETQPGVVLGTAPYMSPEQGRGETVDRQTDVWAFGCLLYELLTGKRAFDAPTLGDTLVAILSREPDWSLLPPQTPQRLRKTLHRCLEKDPQRRAHHMGDVRLDLEEAAAAEVKEMSSSPLRKRIGTIVQWAAIALLAGFSLWALLQSGEANSPWSQPEAVTRFSVKTAPLALGIHPPSPLVALSPNGSLLAYTVGSGDAGQIYLRSMDSLEASPIAGTEGAQAPFFSPDGDWIGFAANGYLKKVKTSGGRVWAICQAHEMHGGSWGSDGTIIFSAMASGLLRVDAEGGEPVEITQLEGENGEVWHAYPQLLPGETGVIFSVAGYTGEVSETSVYSFETGQRSPLFESPGNARYLESGHIAYPGAGSILAVPFDPRRLQVTGPPVAVLDEIMMGFPMEPALAHFAVARNGTLAYIAGDFAYQESRLVRVDRQGNTEPLGVTGQRFLGPRFSPDGTKVAVAAMTNDHPTQVHLLDIARGAFNRLTHENSTWWPLWTPDGQQISFTAALEDRSWDIYLAPSDSSQPPRRLTRSATIYQSNSWSSDGRILVLQGLNPDTTDFDLFALDVNADTALKPLRVGPYSVGLGALSPDNRWLAYISNESGQDEVYVQPFPDLGRKWQISIDGGTGPVWAPSGRKLFYTKGTQMIAVSIGSAPGSKSEIIPGKPEVLFSGPFAESIEFGRNFDIAPDGKSFVMIQYVPPEPVTEVQVILNWVQSVERELAPGS